MVPSLNLSTPAVLSMMNNGATSTPYIKNGATSTPYNITTLSSNMPPFHKNMFLIIYVCILLIGLVLSPCMLKIINHSIHGKRENYVKLDNLNIVQTDHPTNSNTNS